MNTKLATLSSAVVATLTLASSAAYSGQVFEDYARVKDVTPEYERVNMPRKECSSEYIPERRRDHHSFVAPLIGGAAGGIIGAQIGRGNGRVAASAVGAVIGALAGEHMQARHNDDEYYEREVRRCRMVDNWENRISGYRVVYEYQGHTYNAVLPFNPGPRLAVNITVDPVPTRSDAGDRDDRYDREDRVYRQQR